MKHIAIVTGSSSGVGREFVAQLAKGLGGPLDEIWVIARREEELQKLAQEYPTPPLRVLSLDLSKDSSFDELERLLVAENPRVEWLINCAGFGKFGDFQSVGRQASVAMVALNCAGVVSMCSVALPYMRSGARIINVSSIAGIVPQPYLAVYSASKAFVYELSRMLNSELKGTGITVTALCPKFMRTGFLNEPGDQQAAASMCRIGFSEVEGVVRKALAAAVLGRQICIPSIDMRAAALAAKILPRRMLFAIENALFR